VRARLTIGAFVAWMIGLTTAYYALGSAWARAAAWGAISLSGAVAMVAGVRLNRPGRARQWLILAAAALLLGVGDTASLFLRAHGAADPQPLPVDLCYLAMFVLITIGVLGLLSDAAFRLFYRVLFPYAERVAR